MTRRGVAIGFGLGNMVGGAASALALTFTGHGWAAIPFFFAAALGTVVCVGESMR